MSRFVGIALTALAKAARSSREAVGPAAATALEISVLGPAGFRYGGHDIRLGNRKSRALLAYLVLAESPSQTRDRLIGLLWSEKDDDKARASLRQALHEVHEALSDVGCPHLTKDRLTVTLAPGSYTCDLLSMLDDAKRGIVQPALVAERHIVDGLLHDLESVDPAFSTWLVAKRRIYQQRLEQYLEDILRSGTKDTATIAAAATALQNLEPTHEEALRALLRLRYEAGDTGGALMLYANFYKLLDEEFDTEPSQETQELVAAIKLAQNTQRGVTTATSSSQTALAVLVPAPKVPPAKLVLSFGAFDASKIEIGGRYMVDGFKRELMACLVRFREWVICDRPLAPAASGGLAESAEYVIEGDAYPAEGALRLVLVLKEVATGAYLWSERVLLSIPNWFEAQEQIVRRITTALNIHVSAERLTAIADRPAETMKAHDLWLVGQATIGRWDVKSWDSALAILDTAVRQNPTFAPAYSTLAQFNNSVHIAIPGTFRTPERTARALAFARESVRLDPIDSRSQLCLGWSHAMSKQYEQAVSAMQLAYELNENDPWTMVASANCLAFCSQYQTARKLSSHALQLPLEANPLHWSYQVAIRFMCGDYAGCVEAAKMSGNDINPNVPGWKVSALQHLGRGEEARTELKQFYDLIRRRWVGAEPATDETITRWFLHLFPIKDPTDWQRLAAGLQQAGAPVGTCRHHDW
jgi:DNA-binding SARP family transcriptional activator